MPEQRFLPPRDDSRLPHVGTYCRVLPVSLERLYENALDWEHLPHQHRSSFSALRCLDWGAWGWRAEVADRAARSSVIELCLDRERRRWVTRTLEGHGTGAEIWTHAFAEGAARVDIVVDFFLPGVDPAQRIRAGEAFATLYERLYDEDVAMMVERQHQLDRRVERARDPDRRRCLGSRAALALPGELTLGGRDFVIAEVAGDVVAFPRQCPHQLGPLRADRLVDGVVTCPWHGYRFDVRTGDSLGNGPCRLSHLPRIEEDADGMLWITATH
ncbi:MAG: Rieske (2Fe-2S) protein [Pseudomonadales bacterium]